MPIRQQIWNVSKKPQQLSTASLASEKSLEDIIEACPQTLSEDWMLIGRQVPARPAGLIDLLAIDSAQNLVVIELKKERTPRDVVAQCLDYASVVGKWRTDEIVSIYKKFRPNGDLQKDFESFFRTPVEEDSFSGNYQLVIVASELDSSSERIVRYLSDLEIPINVVFFQVWESHGAKLLSRAWLIDPADTQVKAAMQVDDKRGPWNGEYYVSFGHGERRSWQDAVEYGFISGGGKPFHSKTLELLSPGDRIWVNVPRSGYVGVGVVTAPSVPLSEFIVMTAAGEKPLIDLIENNGVHKSMVGDEEKQEYVVSVKWLETTNLKEAFRRKGFFGNQNTVCRPVASNWRETVERLKDHFTKWAV